MGWSGRAPAPPASETGKEVEIVGSRYRSGREPVQELSVWGPRMERSASYMILKLIPLAESRARRCAS
jgi:hypothetical protein